MSLLIAVHDTGMMHLIYSSSFEDNLQRRTQSASKEKCLTSGRKNLKGIPELYRVVFFH